MTIAEKTEAIDNHIEQSKAQCSLDKQTANISALSSEKINF